MIGNACMNLVNKMSLSPFRPLSGHEEQVHGPGTDFFKYNDLGTFFIKK
jgi:hypothetical protein